MTVEIKGKETVGMHFLSFLASLVKELVVMESQAELGLWIMSEFSFPRIPLLPVVRIIKSYFSSIKCIKEFEEFMSIEEMILIRSANEGLIWSLRE